MNWKSILTGSVVMVGLGCLGSYIFEGDSLVFIFLGLISGLISGLMVTSKYLLTGLLSSFIGGVVLFAGIIAFSAGSSDEQALMALFFIMMIALGINVVFGLLGGFLASIIKKLKHKNISKV